MRDLLETRHSREDADTERQHQIALKRRNIGNLSGVAGNLERFTP